MQGKLCGFTHRPNEQANADHRHQHPRGAWERQAGKITSFRENFCVVQSSGICSNQADAQNETKVTHAVDQKSLHVGKDSCRFIEPETDQEIRHQTNRLPAEKKLKQVVAHHQHQHGEGEQGDVGKETVVSVVLFHVANCVDVDHQGNKGHHTHHHGGEAIDHEADFHLQAAHNHPFVNGFIEAGAIQCNALQR